MSLPLSAAPQRKLGAPLIAFLLLVVGALFLQSAVGGRQVLLLMVGAALGLTLYHAAFGFTSAWRVFINERRGAGLRAQMVMLTVAVVLFFPGTYDEQSLILFDELKDDNYYRAFRLVKP